MTRHLTVCIAEGVYRQTGIDFQTCHEIIPSYFDDPMRNHFLVPSSRYFENAVNTFYQIYFCYKLVIRQLLKFEIERQISNFLLYFADIDRVETPVSR